MKKYKEREEWNKIATAFQLQSKITNLVNFTTWDVEKFGGRRRRYKY